MTIHEELFMSIHPSNERLAATNHCSVADHLGQSVSEINPELFVQIEPFLQLALRGEATHDLEIGACGAPPDFSERTLLATCQPVRDEAGEVVGISVAMIDITARRAAEQALRDTETRLQLLRKDF
jgi:PAS domain-containing protein